MPRDLKTFSYYLFIAVLAVTFWFDLRREETEVMAWIYPGEPTCTAAAEYSDGRRIDILKPEYFLVDENGKLILLTLEGSGCNGYSKQNVSDIKKYSKEQYVTVSSSYAGSTELFLTAALNSDNSVNTLVSFVVENKMTGVEIDFEDFGAWTGDLYLKYKQFLKKLGDALHEKNKKLMIDGPAASNQEQENWFVWRYGDFRDLPVDKIVVMAYDYQYDYGVGQPVSPDLWVQNTIKWTLDKFPDKNKISIGLPSYGYKGAAGSHQFSLLTYEQIKKEPRFKTAVRDGASHEMNWQNGDDFYFYQDGQSMSEKLRVIQNAGVISVSVWHLGGNSWFID